MKNKSLLTIIFYIDFAITFCFGMVSWLYPHATFGTIVLLEDSGPSLTLALLSTLSIFYVFIGLFCLVGARTPFPYNNWIALVMVVRHSWTGVAGILGAENEWIIGNPWQDVIIHAVFISFYLFSMFLTIRKDKEQSTLRPNLEKKRTETP